jgi:WhiB family transcriptional regulator, redox-sensing transcriptional regulator
MKHHRGVHAAGLAADGNWRSAASCRSADPDLFFPISAFGRALEQIAQAKAICAHCPVRRQCLAFALRTRQPYGIWGGMTEVERRSLPPRVLRARRSLPLAVPGQSAGHGWTRRDGEHTAR